VGVRIHDGPNPCDETLEWRFRWLVTTSWNRLHRIVGGKVCEELIPVGIVGGQSLCGLKERRFGMPGIFSRMGLPRCAHCCRLAGIPVGDGAPFNSLKGKAKQA